MEFDPDSLVPAADPPTDPAFQAMADRLRNVRRQLSRGKPLANVFEHLQESPAALRAAQRLDQAVSRLSDTALSKRMASGSVSHGAHLPWLIRIVERRADDLESILNAPSTPPDKSH